MKKIEKSFDFIYVHTISRNGKFIPVDIYIRAKAYFDAWDFVVSYVVIINFTIGDSTILYDVMKTLTPELVETIEEGALQLARTRFEEPSFKD